MSSILNPYIAFNGIAREAMEFYKTVFGGELTLNTFKDFGAAKDPSEENNIMHSQLTTTSGFTIMGSDMPKVYGYKTGNNMSISLSGDNNEELSGYFTKLGEGGNISEPLAQAPWGDSFGMVMDKFGTAWMVNIAGPKA